MSSMATLAYVLSPSHVTPKADLPSIEWDPKYRIKVRVICARAYHALFMVRHLPSDALTCANTRAEQHAHPADARTTG